MTEIDNSEVIQEILQNFITVSGKKTSKKFILGVVNNVIRDLKPSLDFLKFISVEKSNNPNEICKVKVENNLLIRYQSKNNLGQSLNLLIKEIYRGIIGDDIYYNTDLREIAQEVHEACKKLVEEFKINLKFGSALFGADGGIKQELSVVEFANNSDVLKPVINALIDLLEKGMAKKEKTRYEAVKTITETINELERESKVFKHVLLETSPLKSEDGIYNVKTEFSVKNVFFFNSQYEYAVEAVSKIDGLSAEELTNAIHLLLNKIGDTTSIEHKPMFVTELKRLLSEKCLAKLTEIGVKLDYIDTRLKEEGYYILLKQTLRALIELLGWHTSKKYAVESVGTTLEKLAEKHANVIQYVKIDKSKCEEGIGAVTIDHKINEIPPYDLAKALRDIIITVHKDHANYSNMATFMDNFEEEIGEQYYTELENIGVNPHLIGLRYT
ncbi:MAG: hypothetical protein JXA91_03690 [Candidatus Thermoplasmatota archaeon]|nr:hypothetical protein [Candidatus Thermoplasmatota archaeon]